MSKPLLKYVAIGMLGLLPGCSESMVELGAIPSAHRLAGGWVAEANDLGTAAWHQTKLVLQPNGRFAFISSSHGLYEGQQRDDPSAWTRIEGNFRVDGNRLHFDAETMTWWDHFESAGSPAPRHAAYPWGSLFDDATFVVHGNVLMLSYNVYPADAPVPVTAEYRRGPRG